MTIKSKSSIIKSINTAGKKSGHSEHTLSSFHKAHIRSCSTASTKTEVKTKGITQVTSKCEEGFVYDSGTGVCGSLFKKDTDEPAQPKLTWRKSLAFIITETARSMGGGGEKALTDAAFALTDAEEKARTKGEKVRRCRCYERLRTSA